MSQFIVIFGGISLLASLVISWLTATGISKRLMHLNGNIGETSGSVGASVNQVSSAAQDVINALHEQTSALHQTGSAIEEISAMVHRSTEHSIEVNKKSKNSKELAENGKLVVDKLYEAIVHLKESNQNSAADLMDSNKKISSILSVINEVTNKTKIINDIVFQTKILSFNASVEAARAGENGKGFAVVADEVGKLAQMSGQAAKDINALLDACLIQVSSTVDETRQRIDNMIASSSELVNEGASVASECQDALSQILQSSLEVSQMVDEISAGSLESSKGVAEITKAIQEIDASSRLTSQAADICTTAAHDLTGEVEKIRTIANDLSHEVQGRSWINQFIWKNAFLLNVDDMDNQHKILIEKINLFATALDKGHLSEMKETYTDLESYTAEHFANEEKYLGQIEYPEIKAHKAIHSSLLAKLSEFSENLGSKDLNTNDLMNFLNDWLLKHILGVDMKYARFSRGERSESVVSLTYKRKDRHAA